MGELWQGFSQFYRENIPRDIESALNCVVILMPSFERRDKGTRQARTYITKAIWRFYKHFSLSGRSFHLKVALQNAKGFVMVSSLPEGSSKILIKIAPKCHMY